MRRLREKKKTGGENEINEGTKKKQNGHKDENTE